MTRLRGLAGVAVVSAVLLTGCGTQADFNPGVAARVGADAIPTSRVTDLAADYCKAAEPQLQGQPVPNHYLNGRVAGALALRSAAEQMLAAHDVAVDASYNQAVSQAETQLATTPAAQRDALIEVQGAELYVEAAELAVGRALSGGTTTGDAAKATGAKEFAAWIDGNDVTIDPRYGVELKDGKAVAADTGVSYAVSDVAKKGASDQPDSTYAATLSSAQRCG